MSIYIIPVLFVLLFIYGLIKKVPIYDTFTDGAKESLKLVVSIFPYICSIFIVMELIKVSGLSDILSKGMAPVLNALGIPSELSELIIIRPLSGNGSIALLSDIYATYGADSYIARCASVISSCSETIFYISAIYFSTTKIKKLRYAIPVSLIASLIGSIIACLICRIL